MKKDKITEAYEEMLNEDILSEDVVVDKITALAVKDVLKIVNQAAKTAAQQSGKPEGRMKLWIASKVTFALKQKGR